MLLLFAFNPFSNPFFWNIAYKQMPRLSSQEWFLLPSTVISSDLSCPHIPLCICAHSILLPLACFVSSCKQDIVHNGQIFHFVFLFCICTEDPCLLIILSKIILSRYSEIRVTTANAFAIITVFTS